MFWENSMYKFDHSARDAAGQRVRKREVMAKDSVVRAPEIYNPKTMLTMIREEEVDEGGQDRHVESEDRFGCEVRDVDATILEIIDSAKQGTCGGWATKGTDSDPHWLMQTMDGAQLTQVRSGVRISLYAGSVRNMNQSRNCVYNLANYQEQTLAEDHGTLLARVAHVRPQLCRLYERGYVTQPNGTTVHVKLMLTADKSGFCHLMGTRNMNHDYFGTQCDCCDKADDMYDLTKDPLTHYDHLTFKRRVGRAHIAMHEALEKPEPAEWSVECDVCGPLTKQQILAERAQRDAMDDEDREKEHEKHSRTHYGQNLEQEPVLPYNDSCTDVLHLYLNIVKAAVGHVFHKPFQMEKNNYSKEVKEVMSNVRDRLNERMQKDFADKKFGGEGVFSLIGEQVKTFMRGGHNFRLVPDLLEIAEPYFDLLTSDGVVAAAEAAPAPAPAAASRGAGKGNGRPPAARGRGRGRGASSGSRGRGGGAGARAPGRGLAHARRTVTTVQQPVSSDDEDVEKEARADPATAQEPAPKFSYKEKVVTMFLSLSTHWLFAHSVNIRDASTILRPEREQLARKAYDLGCDVVQAVCAVCGDEQRQTYLHDIAYGLQKLFLILGKPYLAATEGNESAHQEMKRDFHQMCSHSNQRAGSMLQLMRLHRLRKVAFKKFAEFSPPTKESEAHLGMDLGVRAPKRTKKDADSSIPVANEHLRASIAPPVPMAK